MKDVVKNQGAAEAGQFTNGYYLSTDQVKSDDDISIDGSRNILSWGIEKVQTRKV
jgi:subtilase family serine protease